MKDIDFANYADDSTSCIINDDRDHVVSALKDAARLFSNSSKILNESKIW